MQIALYQGHYRTLEAASRAIKASDVFKRAWKQLTLQPFNKYQIAAEHLRVYHCGHSYSCGGAGGAGGVGGAGGDGGLVGGGGGLNGSL